MSKEVPFPARPSIPPTLYVLLCALVNVHMIMWNGQLSWMHGFVAVCSLLLLAIFAARALQGKKALPWTGTILSCVVVVVISSVLALMALRRGHGLCDALLESPISTWTFEIVSDRATTRYGYRYEARACKGGKLYGNVWLTCNEQLERGDLVTGVGRYKPLGDDGWARTCRTRGVWGNVSLVRIAKREKRAGLLGHLMTFRGHSIELIEAKESDVRAVLAACVCGYRSALDERGLDQLFSACGVAHLVAVSGSHLAILASFLDVVLLRSEVRPRGRLSLVMAVTLLFVMLCGVPPSACRAWLMLCSRSVSVAVGRRGDSLSAVSLVALGMLLVEPTVVGQIGYLLSVVCVLGLALFSPYVLYLLNVLVPRVPLPQGVSSKTRIRAGGLRKDCLASLAASMVSLVMTLPIVCPLFSQISLIAPLSALLVTFPLSCAMVLGAAGICLQRIPVVSTVFLLFSDGVLQVVLWLLRHLARLPCASIPLSGNAYVMWAVLLVVGFTILILWPKPNKNMILVAITVCGIVFGGFYIRCRYCAAPRVCVLDVGQGDAILIQDGSSAILVDTGPDGTIVDALARNHVFHLDAVVLTHLHDDHFGGLDDVMSVVPCENVLVAQGVSSNIPEELLQTAHAMGTGACVEVSYGSSIRVGAFELHVVWPHEAVDGTVNADSLELVVMYNKNGYTLTGLLTGDAEKDETGEVMACGDVGDLDFLKVGHHGSSVSITYEQAQVLDPEVAVASAGEGNSYGHPHEECVQALEAAGARFLCTKDVGDVEIRPGTTGPVIHTQRR